MKSMYPKVKMKVRQEEEEDPASLSLYNHHHPSNSPDAANLKDTKLNTNKPTSVPLRPRAVLSSPENDAIFGTKNKTKTDHSSLKNHNSRQNRHVKCNKSYELEKKIRREQ